MTRSENVSPTAYATGHMWYRLGLADAALSTARGRVLDRAFSTLALPIKLTTGVAFDDLMQARHQGIDAQLDAAIAAGRVTQVIELAAGLSPRGWRFRQRYGHALRYVETDLPHMVAEKRRLLARAGRAPAAQDLCVVDVLDPDASSSLARVAADLDPAQGVAVITEGLMNYLSPAQADQVWRQIAASLKRFPAGVYLSDFYLRGENSGVLMGLFSAVLQRFMRGRMHVHFETLEEARDGLQSKGFATVQIHAPGNLPSLAELGRRPGARRVRILEAWSGL